MKIFKFPFSKTIILATACFFIFGGNPVQAYDQDAVQYNDLGIIYTKKENYDQAISYFKKAIEADTSLTNAYYNLGSVYKHLGKRDKAIKAFQLLLRNTPDDDEAAYLLAGLFYEKQDYEKALIYLNSIEKTTTSYKDSIDLFKKINQKINDSVIEESSKPSLATTKKLTFTNFNGPTGIAEDSQESLYVANYFANTIQVFSPDGKLKTTIKNELIKGPVGIAIDSKDNVYVANYTSNNVIRIDKNGVIKVILKEVVKPYYLYINKSDVLYVSEQDKNSVIRIGIPE